MKLLNINTHENVKEILSSLIGKEEIQDIIIITIIAERNVKKFKVLWTEMDKPFILGMLELSKNYILERE
jgi:hypothetical protein